ncbi:secreted protein containing DUF1501 [Rhodopirellula maiorica SM1]|uniref:Secreted protein containing DUF1501 n=1 Tax=Rhodopirellula maiorica SM1 TaxID=1265738 RepID=M5RYK6_9BACT|nr:DUF1501 domain-containing protein [Rhodopirellula maiorica]EMI19014.1 secreted protein containing DUF1501 [Rhodopirellula maiorica SM1]
MIESNFTRRHMLRTAACGFGSIAASAILAQTNALAKSHQVIAGSGPQSPLVPKAKRIIFLFMQGGVSQVDSFDYKPLLSKHDGQSYEFDDARQLARSGKGRAFRLMQSPWNFQQYGDSGRWVSDLFPETARHADDMCLLHGMHTEGVAHGPATLFLHCGSTNFIRPSFGSWLLYGLGSENENLPGFISIAPSIGNGGARNYGSAFLPPRYQGTKVGSASSSVMTIDSLTRNDIPRRLQQEQFELLNRLNQQQFAQRPLQDTELDAAIKSHELAWRMQQFAPETLDLSSETAETIEMYGINAPETKRYGARCLMARRMCEAGVRFVQVNYGDDSANPAWDQHSNLPKHATHARAVDKPIAALLTDLKQRGLLEDTIVWWGSEFGRTPYAQDNGTGRDHNPRGFTVWLAGGGFRSGHSHGATDEFGFRSIAGRVHMHDLHATLLHQLGLDHKQLTFEHAGRNFRLTDVHGKIVTEILA